MSNDSSNFDPRFDPAFQRGFDGPIRARGTEHPDAAARIEFEEPMLVESESDSESAEPSGRRFNPFMLTLGVVAVALVATGLYLVSRMQAVFTDTGGSTDFDFVTLQVLMYAAPLLVVLGVATAIGMLFLAAVRWGK